MTEIQGKVNFLKTHIRRKGLSKFSGFKAFQRGTSGSSASLAVTVWRPACALISTASPCVVSQTPSVDQQVMDQFAQMKTMLTSFLGPRQETTKTTFCKSLVSEVSPWTQLFWDSEKISVSALAEPLAQMLRLVGSGLKFCKQRLKYGC